MKYTSVIIWTYDYSSLGHHSWDFVYNIKVIQLLILVSTGSTAIVNSNTPSVIYFGNVGSFTFNPFANWPVVTLQGFYVLATYGIIIIWALVLGAIVWGVSIGRFSDLFSGNLNLIPRCKLDWLLIVKF